MCQVYKRAVLEWLRQVCLDQDWMSSLEKEDPSLLANPQSWSPPDKEEKEAEYIFKYYDDTEIILLEENRDPIGEVGMAHFFCFQPNANLELHVNVFQGTGRPG